LKTHLLKHLSELAAMPVAGRLKKRYEKFRAHGISSKTPNRP